MLVGPSFVVESDLDSIRNFCDVYKASVKSSVMTSFYEKNWISNQCSQSCCKNIDVSDRDFFVSVPVHSFM